MKLRPYQLETVAAVYSYLREQDGNPCAVLPTGTGKSLVIGTLCKDAVVKWGGRVLVLAHVKELLQQLAEHLDALLTMGTVGIYSAGLGSRDTTQPVLVAGIQSVYQRGEELGRFDLVIVDEAHRIPVEGDGMYRALLTVLQKLNPALRIVGLTATPYRLKGGLICGPDNMLTDICYDAALRDMIRDGYLAKIISKSTINKADTDSLNVQAGEFVPKQASYVISKVIDAACAELIEKTADRKSVLVFCSGVDNAHKVATLLPNSAIVTGDTMNFDRADAIGDFKKGKIKYLVNVNVLTTGFDAPGVDCVALLRPTASPGLYVQMVGRGSRIAPGKTDCLVLDYGGNIVRHGPVDAIVVKKHRKGGGDAPAKECPECLSVIAAGFIVCPDCGYEFPPPEKTKLTVNASRKAILAGEVEFETVEVTHVAYAVHKKQGVINGTPTMRVDYSYGIDCVQSEWICLEHTGYARKQAQKWWMARSRTAPLTVAEAVAMANGGALAPTTKIKIKHTGGEKYSRITGYKIGEIPDYREPGWPETPEPYVEALDADEIPF